MGGFSRFFSFVLPVSGSGRVCYAREMIPISYSKRNSVLDYVSILRYIPRLEYEGCTDIKEKCNISIMFRMLESIIEY